jgi:glycogen debranching enzyme
MVMFDAQSPDGRLPDMLNRGFISRMFTKPPVHGWCFLKLMESGIELSVSELREVYEKLSKWTRWWFTFRDGDNDGICRYDHGNECGWDNCTLFDDGVPVEAPELTAYLLLQIKCLSVIASKLGLTREAETRENEYNGLYGRFISHFDRDGVLKSVTSGNHEKIESGALLDCVAIVLGDALSREYFNKIVSILKEENAFLTANGLATESLKSAKYEKGRSYWRGSIWAPVIMLITDGLERGGEHELAREIALRFCDMVNGKDGIYENYDAVTGNGNDDPSYTWTAGVFLYLAEKYTF